jgi:isocitrate/isopropylmalate dehydrogenase
MGPHRIALLPGDGIGPEVVAVAADVLRAVGAQDPGLQLDFTEAPIGLAALQTTGDALPADTVALARSADAVLHGATDAAAIPAGSPAPLHGLRVALDAYANLRPARSSPGVPSLHADVDVVIVRENLEGLYSGVEYLAGPDAACSVRIVSRHATQRVARRAFALAAQRRGLVTAVHKLGALPVGDGLWIEVITAVAREHPDVELETRNVDAAAYELVRQPQRFDVLLAENSSGDILSDIAAAVTGGLGLMASANVGDRWAYFEPVHGTAADIAGRGLANPAAAVLAAALLLEHLGERDAGARVRAAVLGALADPALHPRDLGGTATTAELSAAVVERLLPAS